MLYQQGAPLPPKRSSPLIWILPLASLGLLLVALAMAAFVRSCARSTEGGGVKAANEMPAYALKSVEDHKLIEAGERLVLYYDVTVGADASEAVILTTERLVYFKDPRTTAIPLASIREIRTHNETLEGDVVEAQADSGELIKFAIAPFNGGPSFISALDAGWKKKRAADAGSLAP
ncbi:MAG: hypothetical protein ABIP39_13790 [Polyangiaceae bacterium]